MAAAEQSSRQCFRIYGSSCTTVVSAHDEMRHCGPFLRCILQLVLTDAPCNVVWKKDAKYSAYDALSMSDRTETAELVVDLLCLGDLAAGLCTAQQFGKWHKFSVHFHPRSMTALLSPRFRGGKEQS